MSESIEDRDAEVPPARRQHPEATVPERLLPDDEAEARWRRRFTAVRMSVPDAARDEPDHALYVSNASGIFELVTFDAATGESVQATRRDDGTTLGMLSADGRSLWWFDDEGGDEFGSWRHQPFGSGPGAAEIALPDVPPGYPAGAEVGRTLAIAGFADDDGTRIHLARDGRVDVVYRHETDGGVAALSTDETIWVLSHSERGDSRYPALRALAVADGSVVAELDDGDGKGLAALCFSPVPGDQRVLVGHERHGRDELGIWDVDSGEFTELAIDLPGDLDGDFYPDGESLLVLSTHQGRTTMHRFTLADATLTALPSARGVIAGATVRPDGAVWYRHSSAESAGQVRALTAAGEDGVLLPNRGGGVPGSEPVHDIWVDGPGGRVHALLARPADAPALRDGLVNTPTPLVFLVHGGPAGADEDAFDTLRATYLDAGIAVCQVNYRGSTGYGAAWRDALTARIGHTELADIAAVQDALVLRGIVDLDRCAIAGHSWGGFLTLLALGTQPSRWRVGVAGVPVADYLAAYEDEMEPMRAYDRALFGGSPAEVPGKYADASPLSWIDGVRAPVLVMAGENDPRCPLRQIENYLDALASRGADYAVYRFDAGHGSLVVEERIRQTAAEVAFVRDHLTG